MTTGERAAGEPHSRSATVYTHRVLGNTTLDGFLLAQLSCVLRLQLGGFGEALAVVEHHPGERGWLGLEPWVGTG